MSMIVRILVYTRIKDTAEVSEYVCSSAWPRTLCLATL